jgi:transcriptional regulator with XRE-family HTH domain
MAEKARFTYAFAESALIEEGRMTPFGKRIRELRAARNVTQKQMAASLGVSPAWLSALENGYRGRPSWEFLQRIIGYFNIIWDEADDLVRLANISHPRIVVDTTGLAPEATELANLLAEKIRELNQEKLLALTRQLKS